MHNIYAQVLAHKRQFKHNLYKREKNIAEHKDHCKCKLVHAKIEGKLD